MSGKCSIHVERVQIPAGLENHNNRKELKPDARPYVDKTRSHLNYDLISCADYEKAIQARLNSAGLSRKIRKDSPRAGSFVINAPTKDNHGLNKKFFIDCVKFLEKICGGKENIIAATIHNDEKTPHMHCVFVPIIEKQNKKNKSVKVLSYSDFFGKRDQLRDLQTNFFFEVGAKYGLARGEPSDKKHISTREYRANAERVENLNILEKQNIEILNEIEKSKNIKAGWNVENEVLLKDIEKQKEKMQKDFADFEKEMAKKMENIKENLEIMRDPFEKSEFLKEKLAEIEKIPAFFRFFKAGEIARMAETAWKVAEAMDQKRKEALEKGKIAENNANKLIKDDYYYKKSKELGNKVSLLEKEIYNLKLELEVKDEFLNNPQKMRQRADALDEQAAQKSQNKTKKTGYSR